MEDGAIELPKIVVDGTTAELMGFDSSLTNEGYIVNFNLVDTGDVVRNIAGKFLDQVTFDFVIEEGANSLAVTDANVIAMYGFKSFTIQTPNKPTIK